jgi:hypothetical protein
MMTGQSSVFSMMAKVRPRSHPGPGSRSATIPYNAPTTMLLNPCTINPTTGHLSRSGPKPASNWKSSIGSPEIAMSSFMTTANAVPPASPAIAPDLARSMFVDATGYSGE